MVLVVILSVLVSACLVMNLFNDTIAWLTSALYISRNYIDPRFQGIRYDHLSTNAR
jgi:hypothetical protein